ncbi:ABC transporter permease [Alkalicoccus daliensis]|uniref:ABC-2 type transport system permease protein n=1 Tax=Alkalicoccus daliensis TaxID=745820 RepID=A0A1H0DS92_9BACI|nr:ABC transporter permease [Alkalicoccus daliensis]SDN72948.1 ABC-2 type transport system permease protein [Alkalicoccus daliensis]
MKSIFILQLQRFRRKPLLVVSFFVLTLFFVFFLGGNDTGDKITIQSYAGDNTTQEQADYWIQLLNASESFEFVLVEEEEARNSIVQGDRNMALEIRDDDYRMLVAVDEQSYQIAANYIQQVFTEELRLAAAEAAVEEENIRAAIAEERISPVLALNMETINGESSGFVYDENLQALFGMTLFFSIYTIIFSLSNVAEEKRDGTWNRLIVSPLQKWQVYAGHVAYCFLVGYLQIILIFIFFKYMLGFQIEAHFGILMIIVACFTFTIVSVGMLLIGLVTSPQQLQAVIPITATAMAMLGGAFWPVEIVTNEVIVMLSKVMPMYYGMEALKGAALLNQSLGEITGALSILVLMGVITMGIGINLMERRA